METYSEGRGVAVQWDHWTERDCLMAKKTSGAPAHPQTRRSAVLALATHNVIVHALINLYKVKFVYSV